MSHLWNMNMSKPSLAQGSLFTMEELNGCLYENIQDFSGSAKLRLFLSPYLKKMFCRVELPVLWVLAKAICKYFYHDNGTPTLSLGTCFLGKHSPVFL